jgi:carboxypeptidase Taq
MSAILQGFISLIITCVFVWIAITVQQHHHHGERESINVLYKQLEIKLRKQSDLLGVLSLLSWDKQVNMPPKAASARATQTATVSGLLHEMQTDVQLETLLSQIQSERGTNNSVLLNEYEWRVVELAQEQYDKQIRMSKELVEQSSKLSVMGYNQWVQARQENNYQLFVPVLKQWIDLKKQIAERMKTPSDNTLYDVLLNEYETGATEARIHEVFDTVKTSLIKLIRKVRQSKKYGQIDRSKLRSDTFDRKKQEDFSKKIAEEAGFDFSSGRLDASVHPFTSNVARSDVRITTRYSSDITDSILPTLHEVGHGLYEANLDADYEGLPVAYVMNRLGTHESQSIFWERHIGKSEQYWKHYLPELQTLFPDSELTQLTSREVYEAVNAVYPSYIRVYSDELAYPMHIILRFEIERGLFNGSITVEQIPEIWSNKMQEYLGIVPQNDTIGCLQDVHWAIGYIGYFPDYLLGAIGAAQIAATMPDLNTHLESRNLTAVLQNLVHNIHKRGSLDRNSDDLMRHATGEPLNAKYFIEYLERKYSDIYEI